MKSYFKKIIGLILICAFIISAPLSIFAEVIDLREQGEANGWSFAYAILSGFWSGYSLNPNWDTKELFVRTYLVPRASREVVKAAFGLNENNSSDARKLSLYSGILSSFALGFAKDKVQLNEQIYNATGNQVYNTIGINWIAKNGIISAAETAIETLTTQAISKHLEKKDKGLAQFISWISGLAIDFFSPVGTLYTAMTGKEISSVTPYSPSAATSIEKAGKDDGDEYREQEPQDTNKIFVLEDEDEGTKYYMIEKVQVQPDGSNKYIYDKVPVAKKGENGEWEPTEESKSVSTKGKTFIPLAKSSPKSIPFTKKNKDGVNIGISGPWWLLKKIADGYNKLKGDYSSWLVKKFGQKEPELSTALWLDEYAHDPTKGWEEGPSIQQRLSQPPQPNTKESETGTTIPVDGYEDSPYEDSVLAEPIGGVSTNGIKVNPYNIEKMPSVNPEPVQPKEVIEQPVPDATIAPTITISPIPITQRNKELQELLKEEEQSSPLYPQRLQYKEELPEKKTNPISEVVNLTEGITNQTIADARESSNKVFDGNSVDQFVNNRLTDAQKVSQQVFHGKPPRLAKPKPQYEESPEEYTLSYKKLPALPKEEVKAGPLLYPKQLQYNELPAEKKGFIGTIKGLGEGVINMFPSWVPFGKTAKRDAGKVWSQVIDGKERIYPTKLQPKESLKGNVFSWDKYFDKTWDSVSN